MSIIQQLPDRFDHALFAVWIAKVRLVMTRKRPHSASFPMARRNVATNPETAPVDSLAPANGIVRASQLFDGVYSCSDSKLVAMLRDAQHRVLGLFVGHSLGQAASFFRSLVPIFGVVDIRCNGHGAF